jgi:hypothetical protein
MIILPACEVVSTHGFKVRFPSRKWFSPLRLPSVVWVHSREYFWQILLQELSRSRVPKEMGSFLFQHQMSQPVQRSHTAQDVGSILETIQVHLGFAAVGGNCKTEPHAGLHAHFRIAGIISVHEIVPKHQPEVTGVVKSKGDKRETQCAYVSNDIVRVPDFHNVSIKPCKR